MLKFNKLFFYIIIFLILFTGIFLSFNVGITHDELHEQLNWDFNKIIFKNLISGNNEIVPYIDKYYGIGFNFISQPIQYFVLQLYDFNNVSTFGSKLILKHPVVFLFYFISSLFFYKILKKITNDKKFSIISMFFYLLYPYLLGHSFFNSKDIPFLSIWLICSYLSCYIFEKFATKNFVSLKKIIILALTTAFLLSIRISGILIFLQYFFTLIIFLSYFKNTANYIYLSKRIILFLVFCLLFTILFYPVFWKNPLEIINAVKFMSHHYNDICTLTFGKCLKSLQLDSTYIFSWLIVKLPIIIIIGLLLLPLTEKKIFFNDINKLYFGTILLSIVIIPLILIFNKVPLYDEIRQVLFLVPLYLIIGLISLYYFLKKKSYLIIIAFIFLFLFENIKLYPYQYVWLNYPTRFFEIEKNFELDYWGLSGKKIAHTLKNLNTDNLCVIVSPEHSVKPFLVNEKYDCYLPWGVIQTDIKRPFYAIQLGRNLRSSLPYKCSYSHQEKLKLPFYKGNLILGNLIKCN